MKARYILSLLLLVVTVVVLAQPEIPAPQPAAADTNAARQTEIRRRFRARATNALPVPSIPAPGAGTSAATNVAMPAPTFPVPAVTNVAPPPATTDLQPAQATEPAINNAAAAAAVAPATPLPVVPAEPAINPIPVPGAAGAIPTPGVPSTVTTTTPGQPTTVLPPNTTPDAGRGLPISNSPVNPALSPNEPIPAGTIQLQMLPLDQFFELYSGYSGRTVLRPVGLPSPPGFTLKAQTDLTRREVIEAMDAVLSLNGITMIPIGDKFVKAIPSTQAALEGAEISHASAAEIPNSEQFLTRVVKLKTAKPSEVQQVLQGFAKTQNAITPIDSNQTLILRDYASNIKRMLEIIEKIDVMPESDFTLEVIPIKYGKVTDIYATMSALISGGTGAGGATTGGFTGGGTAGGFGGMQGGFRGGTGGMRGNTGMGGMGRSGFGSSSRGGYGGGYGGGSYGGGNYGGGNYYPMEQDDTQQVFPQQLATPAPGGAGAQQQNFNRRLNDIVSRAAQTEVQVLENAKIVPDERSNRLLIFANKRDMIMITNLVNKVDVLLAQVLIEAIIMEVKLGDSLSLGVNAVQNTKRFGKDFTGAGAMNNNPSLLNSLTNFPGSAPEGFSYFGRFGDDFDIAVSAIAKDNNINILSRPRIQTSHAIPGFFFIGETVPYITGFTDYGGFVGSGLSTRSQIQERTIGLQLDVTPFITPEGMVVMEIQQNFDQRGGEVTIDGNPVPLVNSRQAAAMLTVRDGDIIMLGGFISDSRSKSHSGVPLLKDIPLLGALFRQKNNQNDRTELIILMKATVLESPEAAAVLADRERMSLPGVRQAEREFEESETKRMKKVEKKLRR